MALQSFYIPWKHPKKRGFPMFSGGIEETDGTTMANQIHF